MVKFIITVLEALALIVMAVAVMSVKRRNFVHRYFALFLVTLAVWLLSGFVDRLMVRPSAFFVTMQYRFAYAAGAVALSYAFLFALSFMSGKRPRPAISRGASFLALVFAFASFTDMFIKRAEFVNNAYLVSYGSFYPLFLAYFLVAGVSALSFVALKWARSRSIDRSRAAYILIGFGIFFFLDFLFTMLLPGLMPRDVTSDYTYMAVIIPVAFTAYSILRYQLLDVRIALRRSLAYFISLLLFGIPAVFIYAMLQAFWSPPTVVEKTVTVLILATVVALAPMVRDFAKRLASRFLFASLYDEIELLHNISTVFTSTPNIREGIGRATAMLCEELHLRELTVVIPRDIISGKGDWLVGCRMSGEQAVDFHEVDHSGSRLHRPPVKPLVLEDMVREAEVPEVDPSLRAEMERRDLVACLPIRGALGEVGTLLVGHKTKGFSLDPVDLDFLQQFSERLGIFIENYLLSTYLMAQLEEARKMQRKVEELDRFKTDIINVTSHEFRTPITILNGYAHLLREHYRDFDEVKREECVQNIIRSCQRLTSLLDQFITISRFQRKETTPLNQVMPLQELFEDVKSQVGEGAAARINSEVEGGELYVSTDRSYLTILLKNIVDNAIRFSPPSSPVIMKAEAEEDRVRISVRDFGTGMDPSEVRNIFNPFDRLEEVNKHQSGTGLGLYIVRLIADLLETDIEVDTRPGEGTEFSFHLPLWKGGSFQT